MTLSIATTFVPGSLPAKLETIAAAGFTAIELHEPDFTGFEGSAEDLRRIAGDLGLRIALLKSFHDLEGAPGESRAQVFDRLERKLDLMARMGVETLLLGTATGAGNSGEPDRLAADLAEAADLAGSRGLRLACLALPWARHLTTEMQAFELVRKVDHPAFGLALNSFFSLADGSKPARLRDIPGEKIFHVQLSDAPAIDGDIRHLKRHFSLLPGQGRLNLAGFVRLLARSGYQGPWSLARVNEGDPTGASLATDGYRALVNLLNDVSATEPDLDFGISRLPERVHATGWEFIEFAADDVSGAQLTGLLEALCFRMERRHVSKSVELWRQGAVNIVVNTDKEGFAREAFLEHGPSVCDMGMRVKDAAQTVARAAALGTPEFHQPVGTGELEIPAIRGIGANVVHFIDQQSNLHRVWDIEFEPVAKAEATQPAGIRRIDHVAQTMRYDEMQHWLLYYISTFEMKKSPIVNVADPSGVVRSQAIETPEGEIRLNLNGAEGQQTLAGSFLKGADGAGVQHIALLTDDIFETSALLEAAGCPRLVISPNYYDDIQGHFGLEDALVERLRAGNILYDRDGKGEYFQIYSQPIFNGFFFEIVQRKGGYQGYGARNAAIRLAAQAQHLQHLAEASK